MVIKNIKMVIVLLAGLVGSAIVGMQDPQYSNTCTALFKKYGIEWVDLKNAITVKDMGYSADQFEKDIAEASSSQKQNPEAVFGQYNVLLRRYYSDCINDYHTVLEIVRMLGSVSQLGSGALKPFEREIRNIECADRDLKKRIMNALCFSSNNNRVSDCLLAVQQIEQELKAKIEAVGKSYAAYSLAYSKINPPRTNKHLVMVYGPIAAVVAAGIIVLYRGFSYVNRDPFEVNIERLNTLCDGDGGAKAALDVVRGLTLVDATTKKKLSDAIKEGCVKDVGLIVAQEIKRLNHAKETASFLQSIKIGLMHDVRSLRNLLPF